MKKQNIEVEGGELLIMSKEGHYAIIPSKHRVEIIDMIKYNCDNCINNYIETLPKSKDYAEDGTILPSSQPSPIMPKKPIDVYSVYMNDPSYKTRLANELFPNFDNNTEQEKGFMMEDVDKEYNRRLAKLSTIDMKDNINKEDDFKYISKNINSGAIIRDEGFTTIKDKLSTEQQVLKSEYQSDPLYINYNTIQDKAKSKLISDFENGKLVFSEGMRISTAKYSEKFDYFKNIIEKEGIESALGFVMSNDETVSTDTYKESLYSNEDKNVISKYNDYNTKYKTETGETLDNLIFQNTNSEVKSSINSLRVKAMKNHNYNLNTPFNIEDYPDLKTSDEYINLINILKLDDSKINELSKSVANINNSNNSNLT